MSAYEKIRDFVNSVDEEGVDIISALSTILKEKMSNAESFLRTADKSLELFIKEKVVPETEKTYEDFVNGIDGCVAVGNDLSRRNQKFWRGKNFQAAELMAQHFLQKHKPDKYVLSRTCGNVGCFNPSHVYYQSRADRNSTSIKKARELKNKMVR